MKPRFRQELPVALNARPIERSRQNEAALFSLNMAQHANRTPIQQSPRAILRPGPEVSEAVARQQAQEAAQRRMQRFEQESEGAKKYWRWDQQVLRNARRLSEGAYRVGTRLVLPAAAGAATMGMAAPLSVGGLAPLTAKQLLGVTAKGMAAGLAADHMVHNYANIPRPSEALGVKNPFAGFAVDMLSPLNFVAPLSIGARLSSSSGGRVPTFIRPRANTSDLSTPINPPQFRSPIDTPQPSPVPSTPWQLKELPGLQAWSLIPDNPRGLHNQLKGGYIDTKEALKQMKAIEGPDRFAAISDILQSKYGANLENLPKKINYNTLRQDIQEGLWDIGTGKGVPVERYAKFGIIGRGLEYESGDVVLDGFSFANKDRFLGGSSAHSMPEETLGHVRGFTKPDEPGIYNAVEVQSNWAQERNRTLRTAHSGTQEFTRYNDASPQEVAVSKNMQLRMIEEVFNYAAKKHNAKEIRFPTPETTIKIQGYEKKRQFLERLAPKEDLARLRYLENEDTLISNKITAERDRFDELKRDEFKELRNSINEKYGVEEANIEKHWLERVLIEKYPLYNKIWNVPNDKAARAKEVYEKYGEDALDLHNKYEEIIPKYYQIRDIALEEYATLTNDMRTQWMEEKMGTEFKRRNELWDENRKLADAIYKNPNYYKEAFPEAHQTIIDTYSETPNLIKKRYGLDYELVTDNKGNTWHKYNIPENIRQGKGEIRAFSLSPIIGAVGGAGSAAIRFRDNREKKRQ